jgi:AcrR family transcriptional regulator
MNIDSAMNAKTTGQRPADAEPRMRADARRSRARLIEAATAAFAEHGADAPLDDIARRAGVGIGTLYRHFPARIDLQAAVYRNQVTSVCSRADDLVASSPPDQAFAGWLRVLARYLVTKRGLSRAVMASLGKDSELVSSCFLAMNETADRLLATAQDAGVIRADLSSTDVLRLVHGVVIATEQAPGDTDRLLSLLLDGMRAQPAAASAPRGRS